ncbi:MAG TPA: YggS family pyridoxal phosphate-dependent enzyme [Nitrospira sp.]|jgi:pyridoxal phosphate enzyme (YggS family)|nr:YggS family pyridoxal phosphate-dependent enzyme [Nitrospira sp.]
MEPLIQEAIANRVQWVLRKIRSAEEKAGRPSGTVRLVAATKTVTVERIAEGVRAGLSILGENRVQEALPKIAAFTQTPVHWHFIGQLQRRKVRSVIGLFDMIHSVDSLELAQEINRRAGEAGLRQNILLELNIGREPTKAGFLPEDVVRSVPMMAQLPHTCIKGLMAIPPRTVDPDSARPYFRKLYDLARQIVTLDLPTVKMDELSMGMSQDYEVAIEEGATLVRVGTAIFGTRHV